MLRLHWVSVQCLFLGLRLQARYTQWEYPCRDLSPPQCECLCKDPCPGNGRCSDSTIQARGPCPPLGGWACTLLQGHCIIIIWLLLRLKHIVKGCCITVIWWCPELPVLGEGTGQSVFSVLMSGVWLRLSSTLLFLLLCGPGRPGMHWVGANMQARGVCPLLGDWAHAQVHCYSVTALPLFGVPSW